MRILLIVSLLFSLSSFAEENLPFGKDYSSKIQKTFYVDGKLSDKKIEDYKALINKRADQLFNIIYNYRINKKGDSKKKARKKANKNDDVRNLRYLIPLINELKETKGISKQYQLAELILDQDYALLSEITPVNENARKFKALWQFFGLYKINKKKLSEYGEASNLVDPNTGKVLSPRELKGLTSSGFDISKLNPTPNNGIIEEIEDISKIDVKKRFLGGQELHRGLDVSWPAENVGTLDKIRKTQSRPKVIIKGIDTNGIEKEWKLKMTMEIHSEPTAASLASALGLYTDITKKVGEFKVYIGDMTHQEFFVDFIEYFEPEDYERFTKEEGRDEKGNFIIIKEGMLEARFDDKTIERVGPYYPAHKKGKREVRAWQVFNIWINNTNLKLGENNKLIRRDIEGDIRLYGLQHDLGFAFGNWRREKPTDFKWKAIHKSRKNEIVFNFRSAVPHEGWDHVTMADARWFTRKIAQLTRKQITDAVKLGGWPNKAPHNYEQLLIEKLISRRNDMVKNFGLLGEELPNGKKIGLLPFNKGIEKDAKPTNVFLEGYTVDFRAEVKQQFVSKPLELLNDALASGVKAAISGIKKISVNPVWFGIDDGGLVAEVLTHTNRTFTENPNPKGKFDQFIVRDDFALGIRMGKGLGLGIETVGDLAYVKEYALIYTAPSKEAIKKRSKFVVDFKMPYRILKKGLPKEHIFISQNVIEGRGRIKGSTGITPIGPGTEASVSRVLLNRTVLGHKKDGSITLYEDKSKANKSELRIYAKLGLIKLDQVSFRTERGKLERFITTLDGKTENTNIQRAIDEAVFNHNFEKLKKYEVDQRITSDYLEKESAVSLFGFRSWSKELRVDDVKIFNYDDEGNLISQDLQLSANLRKEKRWSLFGNAETKFKDIALDSTYNVETGELTNPYVEIQVGVNDKNTLTKEIQKTYLPFFNGAAGEEDFFDFNPEIMTYRDKWGQIEFLLTLQIHTSGLTKLLATDESDLIKAIAKVSDTKESIVKKYWKNNYHLRNRAGRNTGRRESKIIKYFGKKYQLSSIVYKSKKLLRSLKRVNKETDRSKKMQKLAKALNNLAPNKSGYYSPLIIRVINKVLGEKNYLLKAQMNIPRLRELENKLPGKIKPYFIQGTPRNYVEKDRLLLNISDALDLYKMHFIH